MLYCDLAVPPHVGRVKVEYEEYLNEPYLKRGVIILPHPVRCHPQCQFFWMRKRPPLFFLRMLCPCYCGRVQMYMGGDNGSKVFVVNVTKGRFSELAVAPLYNRSILRRLAQYAATL